MSCSWQLVLIERPMVIVIVDITAEKCKASYLPILVFLQTHFTIISAVYGLSQIHFVSMLGPLPMVTLKSCYARYVVDRTALLQLYIYMLDSKYASASGTI